MKKIILFFVFILLINVVSAVETKEDDNYKVTFLVSSGVTTDYDDIKVSSVMGESGVGNYTDVFYLIKRGILYVLSLVIDITPPTISNLRNTSTTNESSFIEWSCSELCNYSILWYNSTDLIGSIYNNSLATSHNPYLANLTNSTTYLINLTVWDRSGNYNTNNTFNFTTAENGVTGDTTLPNYFNFTNNASTVTKINGVVNWPINLSDETGLSSYIFAHNNSGTLTNVSNKTISGTSVLVNETVTITKARGNYICGQFWFNDSSNNINQTNMSCFMVANTAPAIPTITSPSNNEVSNAIRIEFNSTDADSDSINYQIYINNTLNITTSSNITVWNASDGFYNLTITANDGIDSSDNSSVVRFTLDTTIPFVSIIYPTNNAYISSNSIDLNGSASDDENKSSMTYYWVVNGTTNTTTVDSNSTFNASDGYYNLTLFVSDGLQNGSDTVYFTLDTTTPTINTVGVSPSWGIAGVVFNITANITDNFDVDTVIAYVQKPDENNTATITLNLNNNIYNGSWDSSGKAEGTYVIDVLANDSSGNEKEKENGALIALSSDAQNVYVDSSVVIVANQSIVINATAETNTWLNITTKVNITASILIAEYSDNIESVDATGVTELGRYISIVVDNNTNQNISFAGIRVYYTDAEVSAANLQESTLRLYRYNESTNLWGLLSPGGVETALNYVWGNVTSFSLFGIFGSPVSAAEVTAVEAEEVSRVGGIGFRVGKELELSKDSYDVDLVTGGSKTETLTITNVGQFELTIELDVNLKEYLFLSDTEFDLEPGESKTITLEFIGGGIGTQIGKIMIKFAGLEEVIPVIINVESEDSFFDVNFYIPSEYKKIRVGENLPAQISLLSVGEPNKENVSVTYLIKDLNNNVISEEYELMTIKRELSFVKLFPTKDLKPEEYAAAIEVGYAGKIAISGGIFMVEGYLEVLSPLKVYMLFVVFITAFISLVVWIKKEKKKHRKKLRKRAKNKKKRKKRR